MILKIKDIHNVSLAAQFTLSLPKCDTDMGPVIANCVVKGLKDRKIIARDVVPGDMKQSWVEL